MNADKGILDSINLSFYSYNQFQELMENEIDMKRMEHIQTLKDTFVMVDNEGNEKPYFSNKFLILKYLKMSDEDIELNQKYKLEEENETSSDENSDENSDDMFGGNDENSDESSENDEETNNGIDSEMMGDVQPESSETTTA